MTKPNHILLIDDDIQLHELVEDALMPLKLNLSCVINAHAGIALAEKEQPALILMDLLLPAPSMKGWEAIASLKNNPLTKAIRVVALTAASNESIMKALEAGADDYITKPFTIGRFQSFIMNHLGATK